MKLWFCQINFSKGTVNLSPRVHVEAGTVCLSSRTHIFDTRKLCPLVKSPIPKETIVPGLQWMSLLSEVIIDNTVTREKSLSLAN